LIGCTASEWPWFPDPRGAEGVEFGCKADQDAMTDWTWRRFLDLSTCFMDMSISSTRQRNMSKDQQIIDWFLEYVDDITI
jgi:hypothetical protein